MLLIFLILPFQLAMADAEVCKTNNDLDNDIKCLAQELENLSAEIQQTLDKKELPETIDRKPAIIGPATDFPTSKNQNYYK